MPSELQIDADFGSTCASVANLCWHEQARTSAVRFDGAFLDKPLPLSNKRISSENGSV